MHLQISLFQEVMVNFIFVTSVPKLPCTDTFHSTHMHTCTQLCVMNSTSPSDMQLIIHECV